MAPTFLIQIQAEEQGILTPHSGDTIYEGTSGSTGISLATLARAKGYLAHMYVCLLLLETVLTTRKAACPQTKQLRNPIYSSS